METTGTADSPLSINPDHIRKVLTDFLKSEITRAGYKNGVIGVSGGIDSAVTLILAAEALGKEHVLAAIMPYRTSNPASETDAKMLAGMLGVRSERVDISPMADAYLDRKPVTDPVRRGNVMARQRMIVLYDLSARDKALVIGTSNKTEILLGYGTLFGDTACAVNPLGDLYKTQVRSLAKAIGVPGNIIDKKPSADLWEGQTDEGEMGFTYDQADRLLCYMVDERRNDNELADLGFEKSFVERVRRMIQRNQFKRTPPLIANVSNRTISGGFRSPRDRGM
jgi:NAD+ synthase